DLQDGVVPLSIQSIIITCITFTSPPQPSSKVENFSSSKTLRSYDRLLYSIKVE
ncbi:5048_t:CDS:1, partial [Rhizophagus irregularis]